MKRVYKKKLAARHLPKALAEGTCRRHLVDFSRCTFYLSKKYFSGGRYVCLNYDIIVVMLVSWLSLLHVAPPGSAWPLLEAPGSSWLLLSLPGS